MFEINVLQFKKYEKWKLFYLTTILKD